jgi:predicted secreted hydrolase
MSIDSWEYQLWATVVRRDGTHEVVAVEPLARRADRFYTSSVSGDRYPTRWRIGIPALGTKLTVTVVGPRKQEITQGSGGRLEATTSFTGVHRNTKVSGKNNVRLIGDWKP